MGILGILPSEILAIPYRSIYPLTLNPKNMGILLDEIRAIPYRSIYPLTLTLNISLILGCDFSVIPYRARLSSNPKSENVAYFTSRKFSHPLS